LAFAQIVRTRVGASISTSSSFVIARALEQGGVGPLEPRPEHRVGARLGHQLHHLDEERLRKGRPVDQHRVARTDLERVSAQHLGQPRDSRIGHGAGC